MTIAVMEKGKTMSEWRVRAEYSFSNKPAYQVYRLKDNSKADTRTNREVAGNYSTKEYAEYRAKEKNEDAIEEAEIREERIENNAER